MRAIWFWRLTSAGVALLLLSTGGALWALRAPGGSTGTGATASGGGQGVVCLGYVDVEGGIAILTPTQPGQVVEILAREDQPVKAGDALVRLDETPARLTVEQAKADVSAAQTQLDEARKLPEQHRHRLAEQGQAVTAAQARAAAARQVQARYENLQKAGQSAPEEAAAAAERIREANAVVTAEEHKLAELKLVDPKAAVERAEANVADKKARLAQANYALGQCTVRAPVDGKILRLNVRKGELLTAQPRQPAIEFCPGGPRIVRAEVEQEYADRVALGEEVVVVDDGNPALQWRGKVVHIGDWYTQRRSVIQEPLQVNDVRTLECIVRLEAEAQPRIGQRVRVRIGRVPSAS
jgi:multidrug resistance efflux pump